MIAGAPCSAVYEWPKIRSDASQDGEQHSWQRSRPLGTSQRLRPFVSGLQMPTSNRSDFRRYSRIVSVTSRTAVYGPVRTVVWQGSAGDRRPYADLTAKGRSDSFEADRPWAVIRVTRAQTHLITPPGVIESLTDRLVVSSQYGSLRHTRLRQPPAPELRMLLHTARDLASRHPGWKTAANERSKWQGSK
jgi:hypothetical protein